VAVRLTAEVFAAAPGRATPRARQRFLVAALGLVRLLGRARQTSWRDPETPERPEVIDVLHALSIQLPTIPEAARPALVNAAVRALHTGRAPAPRIIRPGTG
jgi:hypothetical protein